MARWEPFGERPSKLRFSQGLPLTIVVLLGRRNSLPCRSLLCDNACGITSANKCETVRQSHLPARDLAGFLPVAVSEGLAGPSWRRF